jgi:glycosyltransferase involved in cell wall biosynthesis
MRIAQVLTFVSNDGAFGGPVAVAVAQSRELARRGHEVCLIAGWDGAASVTIPGVTVELFRTGPLRPLGFSGLIAPGLIRYLRRNISNFDVVHIHLGRHAIALTAAALARKRAIPFVVQTHGMVMPDLRPKSVLLDYLATRPALQGASNILTLTSAESGGVGRVAPKAQKITLVRNGIAASELEGLSRPVPVEPEVLFLARLHPRKRVLAFADMARIMLERGSRARFTVVGPDEGDLPALRQFISERHITGLAYEGSIAPEAAQKRLRDASVFVLPSIGEVFPMTVLEAMAVGTPSVITEDCGISEELRAHDAALVTDGSPTQLADAVESLLVDRSRRDAVEAGMERALGSTFGIAAVVDSLELLYTSAAGLVTLDSRDA